jgi:Transposase
VNTGNLLSGWDMSNSAFAVTLLAFPAWIWLGQSGLSSRLKHSGVTWANKFIDEWTRDVMRHHSLPELKKFARMIRRHQELIFNYFRTKKEFSSGIVEGFNNKAKLTIRKSYGFRSNTLREIALYHVVGNLPVPEITHRFVWRGNCFINFQYFLEQYIRFIALKDGQISGQD